MNTLQKLGYSCMGALLVTHSVYAEIKVGREKVDEGLKGIDGSNPIETVQTVIKWGLGLLGIVMVLMALWGGWQILTSGSEDEGKEAGKKIIINAIIGIAVIFMASTISNFVFDFLSGSFGG